MPPSRFRHDAAARAISGMARGLNRRAARGMNPPSRESGLKERSSQIILALKLKGRV